MFIGLDYTPAVQHAPGIGRYVRELVRALVRLEGAPRLGLFEGGLGPRPMAGAPLGLTEARAALVRRRLPLPRRTLGVLARVGLGADRLVGGPDLFHRVHPGHPPTSRSPGTVAVAELPRRGSASDEAFARATREAAGVFVFDSSFGLEVAARYGLGAERLHVVPVGCEHWSRTFAGQPQPLPRDPPELIVLGAVRAAREPLRVLAAFEQLVAGGGRARLRFIGRPGDVAPLFREELARSPARDHVEWIAEPREADMPALVGGAAALVHLALGEGSAVTPLEACRMGAAVVVSDLPTFRAALGVVPQYVADGTSDRGLAEHLAVGLADGVDPASRAARRHAVAGFTWEASARAHIDAWRRIIG